MGVGVRKLFYWGLDDDLAVLILVLSAISIYLAFDITRLTKGAPRGWYVVVAAFVTAFIFRAVQLYFDVQSASDVIDDAEAAISLVVGVLFVVGLYMLHSSFRKRLKAAQTS
jgi:glycopeptide antibiotics resistance protein